MGITDKIDQLRETHGAAMATRGQNGGMFGGGIATAIDLFGDVARAMDIHTVLLNRILREQRSHPERWVGQEGGTTGATATRETRIPAGQRFVLRRISGGAPAGSTVAVYDGAATPTNLIHVETAVGAAALFSSPLTNDAVLRIGADGALITAVFSGMGAGPNNFAIRYEGDLYPDFPDGVA